MADYQEAELDDSDDVGQREMGPGLVPPFSRRYLDKYRRNKLSQNRFNFSRVRVRAVLVQEKFSYDIISYS